MAVCGSTLKERESMKFSISENKIKQAGWKQRTILYLFWKAKIIKGQWKEDWSWWYLTVVQSSTSLNCDLLSRKAPETRSKKVKLRIFVGGLRLLHRGSSRKDLCPKFRENRERKKVRRKWRERKERRCEGLVSFLRKTQ